MTEALSVVSLIVIVGLSLTGIFAHTYKDTWLQFIGLSGVCLWGMARLVDVMAGAMVTEMQCFAHVSIALYAIGTALKVVHTPQVRSHHYSTTLKGKS